MKDLIERLERCEGPNFELDCAIFEKMLPTEMFGSKVSSWFRSDDTHYYGCNTEDGYRHLDCLRAPNYTGSVDAALTMLPKGWWLTGCGEQRTQIIYVKDRHEPTGFFYAKVQHIKGGRLQVASARSIAIALCIAALKARMAAERDLTKMETGK